MYSPEYTRGGTATVDEIHLTETLTASPLLLTHRDNFPMETATKIQKNILRAVQGKLCGHSKGFLCGKSRQMRPAEKSSLLCIFLILPPEPPLASTTMAPPKGACIQNCRGFVLTRVHKGCGTAASVDVAL